jgi:hypothetical protein
MRGSLDQPPLVITTSRLGPALLMAMSVGFLALLGWALSDGGSAPGWREWGGLALLALLALFFAWRLLRPDYVVIGREGLSSATWRGVRSYGWRELSKFSLRTSYSRGFRSLTMITFTPVGRLGRPSFRQRLNLAFCRDTDAIVGPWELSAEKLVALLNEALAKWGDGEDENAEAAKAAVRPLPQ